MVGNTNEPDLQIKWMHGGVRQPVFAKGVAYRHLKDLAAVGQPDALGAEPGRPAAIAR